jgi:uncharacterized membrane protein
VSGLVDVTLVSAIVAAISVIVGVIIAILELRHLAKTRRTDLIMRLYERFGSKEIIENVIKIGSIKLESFDDYTKKYSIADAVQVIQIFEAVGVLLEQGLVDIEVVYSLFGMSVTRAWESNLKILINGLRKISDQPLFFSHVDYLFKQLSIFMEEKTRA